MYYLVLVFRVKDESVTWTEPTEGVSILTSRTMCQYSVIKTCHYVESFPQLTA